MFDLKLRDEFLTENLEGTTVTLHRDDKTGALDISSEDFFKITYPTIDLQLALNALGRKQNERRPIVLVGERGRGKSHLVAAMHHALSNPVAAEKWANKWVNQGVGEQLKNLYFPTGYRLITVGLNEHSYKTLWDPLFAGEKPEVGLRFKGRFEGLNQNVPPQSLIEDMLREQPVALLLDELQGWYESATNAEGDSGPKYRAWASSFLQILSNVAVQHPEYLILIAAVLDTDTDAYRQIWRDYPLVINFKSVDARQDRQRLVLHRLFENRGQIIDEQKLAVTQAYRQERFRLLTSQQDPGGAEKSDQEVLDAWPFTPELLMVLEEQILASAQAQSVRDYLRVLSRIYRARASVSSLITPADFTIDNIQNKAVQELIDSICPPEQRGLYPLVVNNLKAVQDTGIAVPYLSQMMGALWMRSFSIGRRIGTTGQQLHLDLTHEEKIDDNAFEDQLLQVVTHSFNIHEDMFEGERHYYFDQKENPRTRLLASARNDANFPDDRRGGPDKKYIRDVLRSDLSPTSTSSATQVIVLGPNWQQAPWSEVEEFERPERWESPVLLVLPEVPANIHGDLGKWLKEHVPFKRNTVRFLLPKAGLIPLYSEPEVYINARASLLAQQWGTREYLEARKEFDRQLHKALENRFERFAVLDSWDYQQPANCRFTIVPMNVRLAGIRQSIDNNLHNQQFDGRVFEELVLRLAANMVNVGTLLEELREPPPPATPPAHALVYLGEGAIADQLIHRVATGKIALRPRGGEWVQLRAGETEAAARSRVRPMLYKVGNELAEMKMALPNNVGVHAAGPLPSVQSRPVQAPPSSESPSATSEATEEAPDIWGSAVEYPSSSDSSLPSGFLPETRVVETSMSYSTGGLSTDGASARPVPVQQRSEALTPLNLVRELEKWEVSPNATLPLARIEFTNIPVADLKRVLGKLPATLRPILEIVPDER